MSFSASGPSALLFLFPFFLIHLRFGPAAPCFAVAVFVFSHPPAPCSQSHRGGRASWRCGVEAPAPPSSTGMPAGRGSLVLEQTDLSRRFYEFPWVSMRFYAHAPRRLQKILHVQSYRVIFQLFLEGSIPLRCI